MPFTATRADAGLDLFDQSAALRVADPRAPAILSNLGQSSLATVVPDYADHRDRRHRGCSQNSWYLKHGNAIKPGHKNSKKRCLLFNCMIV